MTLSYSHVQHVDGASHNTTSITSSNFAININDILVVTVGTESYDDAVDITVSTNGVAWGFTARADSWAYYSGDHEGAYAGVFALRAISTQAAISVTVTTSGNPFTGWGRPHMDVWKVVGANQSDFYIRSGSYGPTTGGPLNLVWTSTDDPAGSGLSTLCAIACADAGQRGAPYMVGDGIIPGTGYSSAGLGISGVNTIAEWTAPAGTKSAQVQEPSGAGKWATAIIEIRPAATVPTVNAGADTSVERTKTLTRTATENNNGNAITAREWKIQAGTGAGTVLSTSTALSWTPTTAGSYTLRYSATNAIGTATDDVAVTVTALRPVVNAGADATIALGAFSRTATEVAGDNSITSRAWVISEGPDDVGVTIGTAAALSWTPDTLGQYVLRYTATSSAGTSDPDYATITVGVTGITLNIPSDDPTKLGVAIAFAGDLTDPDGSSWIYTEVTSDVRVEQGVNLKHGRGDEASVSQPATCRFTLDNRDGKYSLGGRSPYWPNVRQGTPIAVYIDDGGGGGMQTVFTGYADGFSPQFSISPLNTTTGQGDAVVVVTASGVLRRLAQGQPPIISPMRRAITNAASIRAYWPCEDLVNSTSIASAFAGYPPMDFSGRYHDGSNPNVPPKVPNFEQGERFDASNPLLKINDSELYGNVPTYTATTIWECWAFIAFPEASTNDSAVLLGVITTGDPSFWELRYKQASNGSINIRGWRSFSTLPVDATVSNISNLDGRKGLLGIRIEQVGGTVDWEVGFVEVGATGSVGGAGNLSSSTVGRPLRVQTTTDGGHVDVTMGHIFIRSAETAPEEQLVWINAYVSDQVGERLLRICDEHLIPYTQNDGDVPNDSVTDQMGPQRIGTVLEILRDCETCDQGILWDGIDPGIQYTTKRYRESRAAVLTLDVTAGEVAYPFQPVHDDQVRRNKVTTTRSTGSSAFYEDVDGPLGTDIIGAYDDSLTVNAEKDSSCFYYSGWLVHQGTIEGYRWPRLSINLAANPHLIPDWLGVIPGDRVVVTGLSDVNASAPVEDISLAIEGFEQTITDSTWDVTLNTSIYYGWSVAQACATTADTQEFGFRADTDDSEVNTLIAAGQTTLSVKTNSGPIWTTVSDNYPLYLDVGDVRIRATACSGSSSPQTFTIDPMPVDKAAGTPVKVWRPPVLAL